MTRYLFSDQLLGDALLGSPGIRAWRAKYPDEELVALCPPGSLNEAMLRGNIHLNEVRPFTPAPGADFYTALDAGKAFEWAASRKRPLAAGFGAQLEVDVTDLRYDYTLTAEAEAHGQELAHELGGGKPIVVIARHSHSCSSNDPRVGRPNKCLPGEVWNKVARWLQSRGMVPVAVGAAKELADPRYIEWPGVKAYGLPIDHVAGLLKAARATFAIDTGIRHLASAVGGQLFCVTCTIPLWLIQCVPVAEGQRIHEVESPIQYANASFLIKEAQKIL